MTVFELKERRSLTPVSLPDPDREVTGGYTGDGKKMIMVSFVMSQYAEILGAVGKIDPDAFVIVHRAHEINGEGWSRPRGSEKAK